MTVVNVYDPKPRLSKLIEEAAAGNVVVIARGGKPVVLAQAFVEPLRFVTADSGLAACGGTVELL